MAALCVYFKAGAVCVESASAELKPKRGRPHPRTASIEANAKKQNVSYEQSAAARVVSIPAKRFGTISEFGHACAFLCSAQAGYIAGQNILIDGGTYPGVF